MKKYRIESYYEGKLLETKEFETFNQCYGYWEYEIPTYYETKFYENGKYIAENPHQVWKLYANKKINMMEQEMKIYIKAWFGDWMECDKQHAITFVNSLYNGMINRSREERIETINQKHLKGITFEELMKG